MVLWFVTIGALGLRQIIKNPVVITALDPRCAIYFFAHGGSHAVLVLGAIVLCIAGGEALYADMGHFGRRPIAIAWYALVMPGLLLNYFGQGAYLLGGGPHRVSGTAVFMTANPTGVPPVLFHHFKHNKVLHENVVMLSILSVDAPFVDAADRISFADLGQGMAQVTAKYGFMETPDVPVLLRACVPLGLCIDVDEATYYLGRETLLASKKPGMAQWRKLLFALISRTARSATAYFGIPPGRVVELGMQIEI